MKIHGLEKMSLVDYDGKIAATVFTGNCNFRCGFCHNSLLVLDYNTLPIIDEDYILDYLTKRKGILEGVCVTGGEPTLSPDLPEFLAKIKNIGYPVKLDTNGTNPQLVKELHNQKLVDYFAMDIKNNKQDYATIIGFDKFDTSKIEQTVEFFLSGEVDYEFRTTLIKEYHKLDNIKKIGEWIKGAKKYFMQKFKNGENCITQTLNPIDDKTAKEYLEIMKTYVENSALRGYDI